MEAVAGSILSAFFEVVFDRLYSTDWLKYVGQEQVLAQLEKWEKMLRRINAALDDAEELQTTKRMVEIWLNDLKHLAYDLEDVVDELATEVQQRILKDQNHKIRPSNMQGILSSCCVAVNPTTFKFNKEMISKVDMITARLDEIVKQKDDLNLRESHISSRVTQDSDRPPSTSLVNEEKVYGRNEDKKAVLEFLKAAYGDAKIVVIPMTGMGGVGKTTLAQLIYNDKSLQFDCKAWVCVGKDFDVFRITNTIFQSVDDNDDKDKDKDLNSLQVKLKHKLSGKKYLIILDDVWSENYEDWTLLCGPFEAGALGSRIIITTRLQNVAVMTAGTYTTTHRLKELPYNDCLYVFCQHAFGATNFDQHMHLKAIGVEIVKRCKGLPLAAKALGGLLRGKSNTNVWEEVLKSEIWELPDNKINILPALRLSYLHLPPPLKRCFGYCSIFPKDYEFDRKKLVLLWMAEGFLCQRTNKGKKKEELGHQYFDELLSRSFFQQSNDNKSRYVMHDLINDLAQFVSRDISFHLVDNESANMESYPYIRHSSFIPQDYNVSPRFECFYKMMKLRTFLSLERSNYCIASFLSRKVLNDLMPKLKCLRVLSLTHYDMKELPSCVGELQQLRYLDLSYNSISRLPESVGKLFNLETLKLHDCYRLIKLPKSICNLTNLLYLDISWTNSLKEMSPQICNLTSLCMLSKFIVGEGNVGLKISELKKFSQLAGKIEIKGLQNVGDIKDENLIKEKPGLLELHLEWDDLQTIANSNVQDEQTLKSLESHQNASSVTISGFGGSQFPSWVGDPIFSKMVKLELWSCKHIKLLPPLGQLPSLKELRIRGLSAVQEVGSEFYVDDSSFPCLESLEIEDMSEWKQWSWCNALNEDSVGRFHKLRKLIIQFCPELVGKLPSFLPSVEELVVFGCQQLTGIPGVLSSLTSLKRLTISRCNEIVSLVKAEGALLPLNLEYLYLSNCERLKEFNLNGLNILKSLVIVGCPSLEVLCDSKMSSLETLDIQGCKSVSCSPNGKFDNSLKFLTIGKGAKQILESFHYGFPHLTKLIISGCDELESFPEREFPNIPTFVSLSILECKRLKSLTNHMQSFHHLQSLQIYGCDELEPFPEGGLPNSIVSLEIERCCRLRFLSNQMQSLTSLQCLNIIKTEISSLEGCLPPKLTELLISGCEKLSQPMAEWGLHTLIFLTKLTITSNVDMVSFPDHNGSLLPTSLTYLQIAEFKNLESISCGIQKLTSLQQLYIRKCPELKSFPVESVPPSLEYLEILDCPHLKDWCSKDKGEYGPIISYETLG